MRSNSARAGGAQPKSSSAIERAWGRQSPELVGINPWSECARSSRALSMKCTTMPGAGAWQLGPLQAAIRLYCVSSRPRLTKAKNISESQSKKFNPS